MNGHLRHGVGGVPPQLELRVMLEHLVGLLLGHESTVRARAASGGAARPVTGDCQAGMP
ncbi:hypothetical protein [Dietzia maris]|uniref:Uncharacterized protein n=1 Tax=Dietzia maris TaxID=37915 RepID=A0ABT8H4E5_9ACTN|nr:hypothetical protein [Dietzia maris]MDN4507337.1 hypothetical protein [Dietzia maris]